MDAPISSIAHSIQLAVAPVFLRDELRLLARRARLINRAIALSTASALLVCVVIAVLFLGSFVTRSMQEPIALLFIGAMLCLTAALLLLMREILLSTFHLRIEG